MRITSHLFIYEGANQLHSDRKAAGGTTDPRTQNPSTIHHTVQRGVSRVQKIEWNTNTWIDYLWLPVACYIFSVILAPHNLGIRFCCLYVVQFLLCVQKSSIQINSEKVLSLQVSLFPTLKAKTDKR